MSFFLFHILGHRYTGIPRLLPQPQVVRVNQIFNIILDGLDFIGDIILGKKLFIFIII